MTRHLNAIEIRAALSALDEHLQGQARVELAHAHEIVLHAVGPSALRLERMRTARLLGRLGWRKLQHPTATAIAYGRTL